MAAPLNDFSKRLCKRNNVEADALKKWKTNVFEIIIIRVSFYSCNTNHLPSKLKSSYCHLQRGIQDFQMKYVWFQQIKCQTML